LRPGCGPRLANLPSPGGQPVDGTALDAIVARIDELDNAELAEVDEAAAEATPVG
jgi:hypothetical protein